MIELKIKIETFDITLVIFTTLALAFDFGTTLLIGSPRREANVILSFLWSNEYWNQMKFYILSYYISLIAVIIGLSQLFKCLQKKKNKYAKYNKYFRWLLFCIPFVHIIGGMSWII